MSALVSVFCLAYNHEKYIARGGDPTVVEPFIQKSTDGE